MECANDRALYDAETPPAYRHERRQQGAVVPGQRVALTSHTQTQWNGPDTAEPRGVPCHCLDRWRVRELNGLGERIGAPWSQTSPLFRAIADLQPDARIIAILREPASFLRSLHLQFVQVYIEPEKDLRKALSLEGARRQGRKLPRNEYWPGATFYSDQVRYIRVAGVDRGKYSHAGADDGDHLR